MLARELRLGQRWQRWADRLALLNFQVILLTILIGLVLGLAAALFGGPLIELGSGFGGLWSIPSFVLAITIVLGLPSLVLGFVAIVQRRWSGVGRMLAYFGPLVVGVGFILIPHTLDPCARGVWGAFSEAGGIRLCERFGLDLNVHNRFHLFWHMAPTVVLVVVYGLVLRRWHPGWVGQPQQIRD